MTTTVSEHLLINKNNGILYLTLNRPNRLNAFSREMITGLKQALKDGEEDVNVRVIVLTGAGRAFSAGGDVKEMGEGTPLKTHQHIGNLNELIVQIQSIEKPIICAVHGYAAGAGFNLALACDIILAAEETKFILSFSKVGLISDGGALYFLPRLIGIHRAKELLFSAEPILVDQAYSLKIVNQIYPIETFNYNVEEYATKLASGPSVAYGFIKKIANQSLNSNLEYILEQERITQATMVTTEDHKEGVKAFIEKRLPDFKGK